MTTQLCKWQYFAIFSEWKHKPTVSPVRQVVPVKQLGVGTNSLVAKESTVAAHVVAPVVETKQPVVTSKHTQIAGYNVLPQDSFPQQLPVVSQVVKPAEVQKTKKQGGLLVFH